MVQTIVIYRVGALSGKNSTPSSFGYYLTEEQAYKALEKLRDMLPEFFYWTVKPFPVDTDKLKNLLSNGGNI